MHFKLNIMLWLKCEEFFESKKYFALLTSQKFCILFNIDRSVSLKFGIVMVSTELHIFV